MPFIDSLDIANRALQKAGQPQILSVTEDSKSNFETSFAYDKVRRAELRRNVWRFATRKTILRAIDTTTLLLNPFPYSATVVYLLGAVVQDTNGQYWISIKPDNLNNVPGGNNEFWDTYFGPMNVSLYDSTISYFTGDLVYKAGAISGAYQVFMSLKTGNTDIPDVASAWVNTTTYYADQTVSSAGSQWRSLLPFNIGLTPTDGPGDWSALITYSSGNQVAGSNRQIYTSAVNGNVGNDPVTDSGANWTATGTYNGWTRVPVIPVSSINWLPIQSALSSLSFSYPIGTGPASQLIARKVYRLPAGFLREAPQDSKAGSVSSLGAPSGLQYTDWEYESDYLISGDAGPIVYRFVADVTKVRSFDDMFCEGLACRLATAICEPLTQSQSKIQTIASEYKLLMGEARLVNSIEEGATEPAVDDYIACRV
jgi:hypothetical protein